MKSKITTIKVLSSENQIVKSILLCEIEERKARQTLSFSSSKDELFISEERRILELNRNIEQAKIALDNYTHQHQSILYRLRNFFKHVPR